MARGHGRGIYERPRDLCRATWEEEVVSQGRSDHGSPDSGTVPRSIR
jgi:hypothetical protein